MPRTKATRTNGWLTLADILHELGDIEPERVRANPLPGTATEADLIRIQEREKRLYELVDGVLVEKIMGAPQSCITLLLARRLGTFAEDHDLGFTMGADGPARLFKGLVRMPDLSFISWKRMPSKRFPATPIAGVVPNLAVEVLSESNTPAEIRRKLKEYFLAGVELAWVVDPFKRTVAVYTAPDRVTMLTEKDSLDGASVLPGFKLPVKDLFVLLPEDFRRRPRRKGKKGT
jgi:Uma2 family endonuclease